MRMLLRDCELRLAVLYCLILTGCAFLEIHDKDDCRNGIQNIRQYKGKCVWITQGGNLSDSANHCEDNDGSLFSFETIDEESEILTLLGVGSNTTVYHGVLLNQGNISAYNDLPSRPGTPETNQSTISNGTNSHSDEECLVLKNGKLYKEECNSELVVAVCERAITSECSCNTSDATNNTLKARDTLYNISTTHLHVLDDDTQSTANKTVVATTSTSLRLQTEMENDTDTYCDPMDVLNITFSALIDKILGIGVKSNNTGTACQQKGEVLETTVESIQEKTTIPVTEVKFQFVSGLHNGPVMTGSKYNPPLRIDQHSKDYGILVNISRELMELQSTRHVGNATLQTFADSVSNWTEDDRLTTETKNVQRDLFEDILQVAEDLVGNISTASGDIRVSAGSIDIVSTIVTPSENGTHVVVDLDTESRDVDVQLSNNIFSNSSVKVRVSTVTYRGMHTIAKVVDKRISSPVVSVSVKYIIGDEIKRQAIKSRDAIIFAMRTTLKKDKDEQTRLCTYWSFSESKWSTRGCSVIAKNSTFTTCKCDHLTNFAILVMYMDADSVSIQNQQVLFTLTTVGCSLSIACLAMTLITYVYLRMLDNEKIMIHANLSLALMLAQIVFVSSGDAHGHETACKVVALLLHFLFMASFSWMMVEGIALYLTCTRGILANINREMKVKYFLIGWGAPAVIVVVSCAAQFPSYGDGPQYSCWLSTQNGLIWAFLGPMLVVVILNVGVMGLVVKVFLTLRRNTEKSEIARLRGSLRAMVTLLPLLGLGWILSLLVPFSVVFNYFFVIVNTLQGMCIFFLHCICNEEIRKMFREKRRRWSTTRTASDFDVTFHTRRKTGSFDGIKASTSTVASENEDCVKNLWHKAVPEDMCGGKVVTVESKYHIIH